MIIMRLLRFLPGDTIPDFDGSLLASQRANEHLSTGDGEARCSLWWDIVPKLENERLGVIGHFQADSADAGSFLLEGATDRLRENDCTLAVGPMDGNTWRRYRVLTERGAEPAFFMEPDNPDFWSTAFEKANFSPLARYTSSLVTDLSRRDPRAGRTLERLQREDVRIRHLNLDHFEEDLRRIYQVSVISFTRNYLYTELPEGAFLGQSLPYKGSDSPGVGAAGGARGTTGRLPFCDSKLLGGPPRPTNPNSHRKDSFSPAGSPLRRTRCRSGWNSSRAIPGLRLHSPDPCPATRGHSLAQHERFFWRGHAPLYVVFAPAQMRTISAILNENAAKWPDREALIATHRGRDTQLTFAALEKAAEHFATRLVLEGIRPGDAVLVFVPMSIELYVALLGLFRLGAIAVFPDPSSGLGHINACCERLPPAALISVWPLRCLARSFQVFVEFRGLLRHQRWVAPRARSLCRASLRRRIRR
jgi:hypothetical protein